MTMQQFDSAPAPAQPLARSPARVRPASRLPLRAAAFVVLVCLALVGVDGWQLWRARAVQLTDAETTTANLAKSLGQHAHDTFKGADTVLVGLVERIENERAGADLARLHALMHLRVDELPQLHGLFIYDASGAWVVNSQSATPSTLNNAERGYFVYHRSHPGRGPYIGPAIRSKSTGEWIITVSRRIDAADGSFAGVALATIQMDYFRRFYDGFDIGKAGALWVATDHGIILLRRPFDAAMLGRDISALPLFRDYLARAPSGTATFTSRLDNVTRINSYRRLADYPLVVSAALARDEVLAGWRADAWLHGAAVALLVAVLGWLGTRLIRQIARRTRAEAELLRARTALENANGALEAANAALAQQALQDGLTGLANRRQFDQVLAREHARAAREGSSLALVMLDVDAFKQYNDVYGHAAGDDCLRRIAAVLAEALQRPGDLAVRYGGEEMALLLPGTDAGGALAVAETVRARVAALAIAHTGSSAGVVTISAGVHALVPVATAALPRALIEAADRALYAAKGAGRNRVHGGAAPPPPV